MLYRMIGVAMVAGAFALSGCGGSNDGDGRGAPNVADPADEGSELQAFPGEAQGYTHPGTYQTPPSTYETPTTSTQTPPSTYQPPRRGVSDFSGERGEPCTLAGDVCQGCRDTCETCICALDEESCTDLCQ